MAEEQLDPEVSAIFEAVSAQKHFLLSGGAGSGKTYTLVAAIRAILDKNLRDSIACITYTNAAVKEIEERVVHPNLRVSTIHDFLWDNIKNYQRELKKEVLNLVQSQEAEHRSFNYTGDLDTLKEDYGSSDTRIQYKQYLRIKDGIISHDEVIVLAGQMYAKYPKLCGITKDKFPYIFVDEYQDSNPIVVETLLKHMANSQKPFIAGFFGDSMQAIYEASTGNLNSYLSDDTYDLVEIKKVQNRRSPQSVIDLANTIRTDGIEQAPSSDTTAPNMDKATGEVKQGTARFLYSNSDNLEQVREFLDWEGQIKELNLTHNLIALKAGFPELMRVFSGDKILEFYNNKIKKFLKSNPEAVPDDSISFRDLLEQLQQGKKGSELTKV
ncbi:UvrD-helicase domain-containing protein [Rubritalea sp.]|uniref:UvrD-helicase domain-containing protein n=1 Tax=Rubritalea sp. TaxID=2109375 RepID=UPI003EFAA857